MECYDPQTDEWTDMPCMSYNRDGHAVTVLDGSIYAIGNVCCYHGYHTANMVTIVTMATT